jgi:nucleoid-associated protein YgaU
MKTITVAGGNLFALALEHLGDATQWNRIAQANGLLDPFVIGPTKLRIPAVDKNAGGGVFVPAR